MRSLLTISFALLLVGCASSTRQKAAKPYDPSIPQSPRECIGIIVSFAGEEWIDADEMKHKAKQRLAQGGHRVDDSFQCNIRVELIGKGTGCTVEFMRGFGDPIYFVDFDRASEAGLPWRVTGDDNAA